MKKEKTILIVLDGFDYSFISKNSSQFSLFRNWLESGQLKVLNSVVPADSIPSWTSIYTGMNPAQHGIIESIDYLDKKTKVTGKSALLKNKTFWDKLSKNGKQVFIFNPFIASPAWDVNGLMICKASLEDCKISTNKPDEVNTTNLLLGGDLKDNPNKKTIGKFLNDTIEMTENQFSSFNKYFSMKNYDFGFLGVTTPDRLQHFLWKYTDPDDYCYIKNNKYQNSILNGYKYFEKKLIDIIKEYGDEYNILVISDHGHGRRCQRTFYINQWLIVNSFIKPKGTKKRFIEYCKNLLLLMLAKTHKVQIGMNFLKKFKFLYKVKNADYVFKKKGPIYAPNFDGVNPFGGICVKAEFYNSSEEYELIRQSIIDKLKNLNDNGKKIIQWVKRREEVYQGEKVVNYPEIIYKMDDNYGVDRGLFGKRLFGISAFHEIVSGGHRYEGVMMSNETELLANISSVIDIHNKILELYNIRENE